MQQHAWAAAVQTPGGAAGQFAARQALLVALRAQQAGAAGGGAAAAAAPEATSFGPAVDQGHKSLFCFFLAHKVSTNHKAAAQWLRREASAVAREQIHKTFGVWHNSFQDTRHAQEGTTCS